MSNTVLKSIYGGFSLFQSLWPRSWASGSAPCDDGVRLRSGQESCSAPSISPREAVLEEERTQRCDAGATGE